MMQSLWLVLLMGSVWVAGPKGAGFRFDPSKLFVDKPLRVIPLETYDTKKPIPLDQWKGKKAILINFFATWCEPCKKETPFFVKLYEEYRKKGVEFISVDVMEKPGTDVVKDLGEYIRTYGVTWPMAMDDGEKTMAREFRIRSLPLNIGVDIKGVVRFYHVGSVDEAWLREHLDQLLGVDRAKEKKDKKAKDEEDEEDEEVENNDDED